MLSLSRVNGPKGSLDKVSAKTTKESGPPADAGNSALLEASPDLSVVHPSHLFSSKAACNGSFVSKVSGV